MLAFQLHQRGFLFGITEYDDGVYFGNAVRLVHGALPYRDFVSVDPPGMMLALSPIALLSRAIGTRDALALARVLTVVVSGLNVCLLGRILRHRGLPAVVVGCTALAAFPATIMTSHTLMLGPYLVFFCLLGAALMLEGDELSESRWRLVTGGLAFGFAGAVKVWAILPVAVMAVLCLPRVRRRLWSFARGVVVGFAVPCAPFFAFAPVRFFHQVIAVQLIRSAGYRVPLGLRMQYLTGLDGSGLRLTPALVGATAGVMALFVVGAFVLTGRRMRVGRLEWFALGSAGVVGVAMLVPGEFYYHYGAFFAPFLAACLGLAVARWAHFAGTRATRHGFGLGAVRAANGIFLVAGAGVVASGAHFLALHQSVAPDPGPVIAAHVPAGACVLSDLAGETLTANRFVSSSPTCPLMVDSFGTDISLANGRTLSAGGAGVPAVQRAWLSYFERAQFVLESPGFSARVPMTPEIAAYFQHHFVRVRGAGVPLYERKPRRLDARYAPDG